MLKLKLQYSGHLMWRTDPLENTLMLGKIEDRRRRGQQDEMVGWHHWLDGRESEWTLGVGDGQGGLACCDSWSCRVGHDWATDLNWTDSIVCISPNWKQPKCPMTMKWINKLWWIHKVEPYSSENTQGTATCNGTEESHQLWQTKEARQKRTHVV